MEIKNLAGALGLRPRPPKNKIVNISLKIVLSIKLVNKILKIRY